MSEVGSDAWIAALAARAATAEIDPDVRLVVQHELTDTGAAWWVELGGGRATVGAGRHASPDVTFTEDGATAAAISAGELPAQQAFMDGRLKVRGAVDRLVTATNALAALGGGG